MSTGQNRGAPRRDGRKIKNLNTAASVHFHSDCARATSASNCSRQSFSYVLVACALAAAVVTTKTHTSRFTDTVSKIRTMI